MLERHRTTVPRLTPFVAVALLIPTGVAAAQMKPRGSLMARTFEQPAPQAQSGERHALRDTSMFAIAPPEIRTFQVHDLVQIIVRESSRAESSQELETEKEYLLDGRISAWPHLDLVDLLQLQLEAGNTQDLPEVRLGLAKGFEGDGDYSREDDFTARLTAEVIDILPNGNLILEARTNIRTDEETSEMKVTGVCRPDDITAANTLLSSQVHDLKIEKIHAGELKKTTEKGIIAKIIDAIFAF